MRSRGRQRKGCENHDKILCWYQHILQSAYCTIHGFRISYHYILGTRHLHFHPRLYISACNTHITKSQRASTCWKLKGFRQAKGCVAIVCPDLWCQGLFADNQNIYSISVLKPAKQSPSISTKALECGAALTQGWTPVAGSTIGAEALMLGV